MDGSKLNPPVYPFYGRLLLEAREQQREGRAMAND